MSRRQPILHTPYEIQRRARLKPVECWEKRWVEPTNGLPGSSYKILKWVKTTRRPEFSDDEGEDGTKTAVVVDEELEDARLAAALPETDAVLEGDAAEGGENENEEDTEAIPAPVSSRIKQLIAEDEDIPSSSSNSPPITQPESTAETPFEGEMDMSSTLPMELDNLPTDESSLLAPLDHLQADDTSFLGQHEHESAADLFASSFLDDPGVADDSNFASPFPSADHSGHISPPPLPAPHGPSLGEISAQVLREDEPAFEAAPTDGMIGVEGVIADEAVEFAIGAP